VVIDPIRTMTADSADWFVQPLPGTDTALALGMMHVIVRDGLTDDAYVRDHTIGFEDLREEAAAWTPERTAEVCGLDVEEIERLAHAYATTTPAAIRMLIGAEHHENGAMIYRTVACLPLLTGAWRHRGGGLARSSGSWFDVAVDDDALAGPQLGTTERRGINQSLLGRALAGEFDGPPVAALVVWNGNPLVTLPNTELTRRGLMREDLFTVVHEQFLTDTARYADIVLPATTQIEQRDVVPAWGHLYLGWNDAAIAPIGESVSNTELFRRLGRAMGYTEPELFASDDDLITAALHQLDAETLSTLQTDGFVRIALPDPLLPYADGGFDTPSGKALLRNDSLASLGVPTVPTFLPPAESPTGDPALFGRYPLVMLTTKSHNRFLNSSYSHLPKHGPLEGVPMVEMHATDAAERGIADGDRVRVHNDRGSLDLVVRLSERVRPGLVTVPFGWWMHQHDDGNVANSLTNDTLTDFGGGVAYHDNLVEVSPL
jgi:anaerobic selenocysteine-containing dehydrogenase